VVWVDGKAVDNDDVDKAEVDNGDKVVEETVVTINGGVRVEMVDGDVEVGCAVIELERDHDKDIEADDLDVMAAVEVVVWGCIGRETLNTSSSRSILYSSRGASNNCCQLLFG
jgi:hypothetical protein